MAWIGQRPLEVPCHPSERFGEGVKTSSPMGPDECPAPFFRKGVRPAYYTIFLYHPCATHCAEIIRPQLLLSITESANVGD
jgi:hypothetical protein